MHIQITRSNPNRKFEDCDYYEFNNVSSVTYFNCENRASLYTHEEDTTNINQPHYKYFICEAPGSPAFGHWVCEFFYPSLSLIQHFMKDPDFLFVLFDEPKRYMINFLLRIGISRDRIIIASDTEDSHIKVVGPKSLSFLKTDNTVICPPLYSMHDSGITNEDWERQYLRSKEILPKSQYKKIPFVLLKRCLKDNYTSRSDVHDYDKLEEWVIKNDGIIVDPYLLNNIYLQESIIRDTGVIITNSGSGYTVNGVFAEGSIILVLDEIGLSVQKDLFPSVKVMDDYIRKYNQVHIVSNVHSIINTLENL